MIGTVLEQSDLMRLTGLRQKAALRRHLRKAGIPFKEAGGVIFTTQGALDAAMVGREKTNRKGPDLNAITTKGQG
jgi:predicted nucleotidyltransferase